MKSNELYDLISMGEGLALEFKRSAAHLGREICAFANSAGGIILLGVDDDGTIVGISNINRIKSEVQNISRAMDPSIIVDMEVVDDILVITVPSGLDKPYSANGKFYFRDASTCQQMSRNEICEFFFAEGLVQFDRQSCDQFNFNVDFDVNKYLAFAKAASLPTGLQCNDVLFNLKAVND